MVWLVVGLPAMSILMSGIYATIAFRVFDGVVVDDYYRRGRAINRVLERDQAAGREGLTATVALDAATGELDLTLDARDATVLPVEARLSFLHATRAGVDRLVDLRRDAAGRYRARIATLAPGKYHVQLETAAWRLVGQLRAPADAGCALAPAI
jgi:hypothetical protein